MADEKGTQRWALTYDGEFFEAYDLDQHDAHVHSWRAEMAREQALREALSALADCHWDVTQGVHEATAAEAMIGVIERSVMPQTETPKQWAAVLAWLESYADGRRELGQIRSTSHPKRAELLARAWALCPEAQALAGRCAAIEVRELEGVRRRIGAQAEGWRDRVRDRHRGGLGGVVEADTAANELEIAAGNVLLALDRARAKMAETGTLLQRVLRDVEVKRDEWREERGTTSYVVAEGMEAAARIIRAAIAEAGAVAQDGTERSVRPEQGCAGCKHRVSWQCTHGALSSYVDVSAYVRASLLPGAQEVMPPGCPLFAQLEAL